VLIAEDLLLLLTDDRSGRLTVTAAQVDIALGGANLVELTLAGKVDLTREGDHGRPGRIVVRDATPPGDPVLDAALQTLVALSGKKPSAVIRPLSKNLRRTLYERLVGGGILRAEHGKVLGIFPLRAWPTESARHEEEVRRRVVQDLVQRTTPDTRSAALISLLHALKCEHKIVDPREHDLSRRELRARAGEIAKGSWGSEAVRKAIEQMMAAVLTATAAAGAAAAGGG
jgi:hypothetical protein